MPQKDSKAPRTPVERDSRHFFYASLRNETAYLNSTVLKEMTYSPYFGCGEHIGAGILLIIAGLKQTLAMLNAK
jgi:hypothetical protein